MTAIISAVGELVTAAATWVGTWVGTMFTTTTDGTALGFIGFFAIIPLVGLGVGLLRRLLSVN